MLTTGQDVIPGLVGSAGTTSNTGDDTIIGTNAGAAGGNNTTLTAADILNGGDGTDSLFATLDAGSAGVLPAAQYSNIENYFIRNVSTIDAATTFDFSTVTGEQQVWNDRSVDNVTVTGLAAGTVVGVKGNGAAVAGVTSSSFQ